MASTGTVVAAGFQSAMYARRLVHSSICSGRAARFASLLANIKLAEFLPLAGAPNVDTLIGQFAKLEIVRRSYGRRSRTNSD
jgi:hypothetical protein